jgi:anti-sigma factor ChrR (cupin superfamily)
MKRSCRIALAALIGLTVSIATTYAADAGKPVTMTPDQMKWVANPTATGVMTAAAWGDPDKGAHGAFHKFIAGFTAPLHTHSANTRIVVISGTMAMSGADGKEMKFPPGSFYTQPNTFPHVTKCLAGAGCLVYLEADGKWDLKPVEAMKK